MFESQFLGDFKKKKIQKKFDLEPQEILLDGLAQEKAEELGISEGKFEIPLSRNVLKSLYFLFLVLLVFLFNKTFQLQVIQGEDFSALAQKNKFIIHQIKATRGVIYDKNMEQLVFNKPSFDLVCNKNTLPKKEQEELSIITEVAGILEEDFKTLKKKINDSEELQILISENLSHQKLIILETRIAELFGFEIERNSIREYKNGEFFSHLIGYTGKIRSSELKENPEFYSITDIIGRDGIEKSYEEILRKKPGKLQVERDVLGNVMSKEIIQFPEPGQSLVLWLDANLQRKIKEEIEKKLREVGIEKAAAVALDPKTGGVLASVSLPSFDNNIFSIGDKKALEELFEDENDSLFNRAIAGIGYPTGSTVKPLMASAALEEKIINPQKTINCQGEVVVENIYYDPDHPELGPEKYVYHDWKVHSLTNLRKAIAQSCNVYFYQIGGGHGDIKGLGPERIKEYFELFGWGGITGIDLPAEGEGILPEIDKDWRLGNTYHLSIGQGPFAVTPLQVANAFVAIANEGKLLKPQAVQKIVDGDKNLVQDFTPEIIRENFIDQKNLQIVREGMRQAVTAGSATGWLDSLPVNVAAKTGTAQTSKQGYYHKWVTVFAPYDDPEIVLTILLEDVKGTQTTVLPIAKAILEWYFSR